MRSCYFFIFYFSILHFVYPQQYAQLPEVVPTAPNVASLGKYVETPVSSANGIPRIGLPIYTIEEGDISVPITLSYHAGGIRVEEISSWIGLGWNLQAGGVISRTAMGLPDDYSSNGYIQTSHTVEHFVSLPHDAGGEDRYYQLSEMTDGYRDYEPDIFTFNFGEYSGRFMYNQLSGQFIQLPFSNILIEPVLDTGLKIEGFIVTAPTGFKYYFGKVVDGTTIRRAVDFNYSSTTFSKSSEGALELNTETSAYDHITAWHLLEIISPSNRKIKFNYQNQRSQELYKTQESFITGGCDVRGHTVSFSETWADISLLQSIEFSDGRVEFVLDAQERIDYKGTNALSEIKIFRKNDLLKTFDLSHGYFQSATKDKWTTLGDPDERMYRLKLLSVQEVAGSGEKSPPFSFEYNDIRLPNRFSNAQDYWGYYNSKDDNGNLIPKVKLADGTYAGTADRTIDKINSKAGMLQKIIYPLGGTAEYFFENNTASQITMDENSLSNIRNRGELKYFDFVNAPAYYDLTSI